MRKTLLLGAAALVALCAQTASAKIFADSFEQDLRAATGTTAHTLAANRPATVKSLDPADYADITDWVDCEKQVRWQDAFIYQATGGNANYGRNNMLWIPAQRSKSQPMIFKLVNIYSYCQYAVDNGTYVAPEEGEEYVTYVDCRDAENVTISKFNTGVKLNGEFIYASSWSPGTLNSDNLITYPDWGVVYYVGAEGGAVSANWQQAFAMYTPDAVNCTIDASQEEYYTGSDRIAHFSLDNIGPDVDNIKVSIYRYATQKTEEYTLTRTSNEKYAHVFNAPGLWEIDLTAYDATGNEGTIVELYYCVLPTDTENAQWQDLEYTVLFTNPFMDPFGTSYQATYECPIQVNKENENLYRLVNPMRNSSSTFHSAYAHTEQDAYFEFDVTDPNAVVTKSTNLGWSYGSYQNAFIYARPGYNGTLADGAVTFPNNAFYTKLGGSFYISNKDGAFRIIFPAEHTITAISSNESYGTVAITNPETEGATYTGRAFNVTIKATPAEGYAFLNWTDADGNVVSTNAEYTYTGSVDQTYTANWGVTVNYNTPDTESGIIEVTTEGNNVARESVMPVGTVLDVKLRPEAKYEIEYLKVNGQTVELTAENTYSLTLTEAVEFEASFSLIGFNVAIESAGNGRTKVYTEINDDMSPKGEAIVSGTKLPVNSEIYLFVMPEQDGNGTYEDIEWVVVTVGDNDPEDYYEGGFLEECEYNTNHLMAAISVEGEVAISVSYATEFGAIGNLFVDQNIDAPVEIYNLQGVRVTNEAVTPGLYIVRQGNKATKILVK